MAQIDPSTGPIPRDEFMSLVDAPYGEATKRIRKYDPMYGRQPGEKILWRVEVQSARISGTASVKAASEKEAEKLAENLSSAEIDWDYSDYFDVVSVEPEKN